MLILDVSEGGLEICMTTSYFFLGTRRNHILLGQWVFLDEGHFVDFINK